MKQIIEFSDSEKQQPWFRRLREALEAELDRLRKENDLPLDPIETAAKRGQITEIRRLLNDMGRTQLVMRLPTTPRR